eukprot:c13570_g1_i2 orf=114-476(-)
MARNVAVAVWLLWVLFFWCYPPACGAASHTYKPGARFPVAETEFLKKKAVCLDNINNGLWGSHCKSSDIAKENCALQCISDTCYEKIYGQDSLEEGEVDFRRNREFLYCIRRQSNGERVM